jgi:hypothetical protein
MAIGTLGDGKTRGFGEASNKGNDKFQESWPGFLEAAHCKYRPHCALKESFHHNVKFRLARELVPHF